MTTDRVVLVTGVAGYWGGRLASRLAAQPGYHVIGLDRRQPHETIKGLDFVQADIRNPLLVDLLKEEGVEAVCHLTFVESLPPSESAFETNVMGTMKVLGACAEAGVQQIVLKSSTAVYGARSTNSAFLTEAHPLHGSRRYGYTRDLVEIEAFCNGFRRQVPDMCLTILRFPGIIGPTADTPMSRFLRQPWTPVLLGFDPMMQIIHEDDVVDALIYALDAKIPGAFNVAADGVMPLFRLVRLAGKVPLPILHPLAYLGQGLLGGTAARVAPIEMDYLRYPWVGDLAKMREEFGFVPTYTAGEALREFAGHQRLRPYESEEAALAYDQERLHDTIERRRRQRGRETQTTVAHREDEYNDE